MSFAKLWSIGVSVLLLVSINYLDFLLMILWMSMIRYERFRNIFFKKRDVGVLWKKRRSKNNGIVLG